MIQVLLRNTHTSKHAPTYSQSLKKKKKNSADTCQTLSPSFFWREETIAWGKTFTLNYTADKTEPKTSVDLFSFTPHQWQSIKTANIYKPGRWSDISNELSIPWTLSNTENLSEFRDNAVCGTIEDLSVVKVESLSYPLAPLCHQFPAA